MCGYCEPLAGYRVYQDLPPVPRAILFGELLNHFFQVWIAGPKTPREPVSATLSNPLAVRYNVELAGLARCADHVNVQALLDQGHETRDLGTVVLSRWTVNDFDLHVAPLYSILKPTSPVTAFTRT